MNRIDVTHKNVDNIDRKNFFGKGRDYWNNKWCSYYCEARQDYKSNIDTEAFCVANRKLKTLYKAHYNAEDKQLYFRW